jgi:hypothetical protein
VVQKSHEQYREHLSGRRAGHRRTHINGQTHRMSHAVRADRLETLLEAWAEAIALAEALSKRP